MLSASLGPKVITLSSFYCYLLICFYRPKLFTSPDLLLWQKLRTAKTSETSKTSKTTKISRAKISSKLVETFGRSRLKRWPTEWRRSPKTGGAPWTSSTSTRTRPTSCIRLTRTAGRCFLSSSLFCSSYIGPPTCTSYNKKTIFLYSIDENSQKVFPIIFLNIQLIYWTFYLYNF